VSTQAQTTRRAIPHRTAENRWTVPTPTMAPVIVCVVETGTPRAVEVKSETAGLLALRKLLAQLALVGWTRSGLSSLPDWASQFPLRGTAVLCASPSFKMAELSNATRATLMSLPHSWTDFAICDARLVDIDERSSTWLLEPL